jgi:hypothetical protein
MKLSMAAALAGMFLFLQPAQAAESTVPEPLRACKSLRKDVERLACYDRTIAHIESGAGSEATLTPENMFGGSTAIAPPAGIATPEREELKQIAAKVIAVSRNVNGLLELRLDNDQIWRQQEADVTLIIETGDSVTISRASLGTFRLTDKRGRSSRFKRVR